MSEQRRVRLQGRIAVGVLAAVVLSACLPGPVIAQKLCFSNTSAQIGHLHDITDSLCLRPRALAHETGRTGYWSLLRYSEKMLEAESDRGTSFLLTFHEEQEFSPFLMYDNDKPDGLPLRRPLLIRRTANGVLVRDAASGEVLKDDVTERIARMYSSPTPHESTMALLRDRCVEQGDSTLIEEELAREVFDRGGGEQVSGPVLLRTIRVFDSMDVTCAELLLTYEGTASDGDRFEEVTSHRITMIVREPSADPLRIMEHRVRYLRDAASGSHPRNTTYIMRCLRFVDVGEPE